MKPQLKTITWSDFDQTELCYSPQEKYGYFSGTILDILKDARIPNEDKIWAFTREGIMGNKTLRLFAVRCARQAQHLIKDQKSVNALDVAERYANGLATDAELAAATAAVWTAARDARRWAADRVAAMDARRWAAERAAEMAAAWASAGKAWQTAGEAAKSASREASREASRDAAWAAWAAAWDAAWKTQVQIAIDLINEFYEV